LASPQREPDHDQQDENMSSVRVLVGTRKGAFILKSDETRRDWQIEGPFLALFSARG